MIEQKELSQTKINKLVRDDHIEGKRSKKRYLAERIMYREELIEKGGKCNRCSSKFRLILDEIIPRSLLPEFGIDPERDFDKENHQLLCTPCNNLKGCHLDFSNPLTKKLLLKYLKNL